MSSSGCFRAEGTTLTDLPRAENRRSDPDMGRSEPDGFLEIGAHPHRQPFQTVAGRDVREQGKMHRRLLVSRRDAHQPADRQPVLVAARGDERIGVGGQNTRLLGFLAGIDLDQHIRSSSEPVDFAREDRGEFRPVDRFDRVEQGDRIARLVGLQRSDQMEAEVRPGPAQRRKFGFGFLHPVFAEHEMPGRERRLDGRGGVKLADRDQTGGASRPAGGFFRRFDTGLDVRQAGGDVTGRARRCFWNRMCRHCSAFTGLETPAQNRVWCRARQPNIKSGYATRTEHRQLPQASFQTEQAIRKARNLIDSGRADDAASCLRQALAGAPDDIDLLRLMTRTLLMGGRRVDARETLLRFLKIRPDDGEALAVLGEIQHAEGDYEGAEACLEKAIALVGETPALLNNLAIAVKRQDRPEDALGIYRRALRVSPDNPEILCNIGSAEVTLGRVGQAERRFREALRVAPENPKALQNLGLVLLGQENFEEGWPLFLRHEEIGLLSEGGFAATAPLWRGEKLDGGRLLIWRHQGIGDELIYASMLPDLVARGFDILYKTEPRTIPLLARSFPTVRFSDFDDPETGLPGEAPVLAQCPVHLLGAALRTSPGDFPRHTGYLKADAARTEGLRAKYGGGDGPLIGISWRSKAAYLGSIKSSDLADWKAVLTQPGATFVSLQYGGFTDDIARARSLYGIPIVHDPDIDQVRDVEGLACQVAAMDLVISTSNATVHVAGALGVPVWMLLPRHGLSLWYWFGGRKDCPWYPSMRMFRQRRQGDWRELLERVGSELPSFLRAP